MKVWNDPALEKLNINETAGGGKRNQELDYQYIQKDEGNGIYSEWVGFKVPSGN